MNKTILYCLSLVSVSIALFFAFLGAWPILPFAGLELALVAYGMHFVSKKLRHGERIEITHDTVHIYYPFESKQPEYSFNKADTYLLTENGQVELICRSSRKQLGQFLTLEERQELRNLLEKQSLLPITKPTETHLEL